MTDPLGAAVKRLRNLREDVERLKSGSRREGLLRVLRQASDEAVADDTVSTGPAATASDEAHAQDSVSTGPAASATDDAAADDSVATTVSTAEGAAWNEGAWNEDHWD